MRRHKTLCRMPIDSNNISFPPSLSPSLPPSLSADFFPRNVDSFSELNLGWIWWAAPFYQHDRTQRINGSTWINWRLLAIGIDAIGIMQWRIRPSRSDRNLPQAGVVLTSNKRLTSNLRPLDPPNLRSTCRWIRRISVATFLLSPSIAIHWMVTSFQGVLEDGRGSWKLLGESQRIPENPLESVCFLRVVAYRICYVLIWFWFDSAVGEAVNDGKHLILRRNSLKTSRDCW